MAQNTNILLPADEYTRADYTALRAYCMRLPIERIADLYYTEDSPPVQEGLERYLIRMRNTLVERAIANQPAFADALTHARKTGQISAKALGVLVQAADLPKPTPAPADPISRWLRPRTVRALKGEGMASLADLVGFIKAHGVAWWRSVPRIGATRAAVLVRWLRLHPVLGDIELASRQLSTPLQYELLDPERSSALLPLGGFCLPVMYDGQFGVNRSSMFPFISAPDDLAAIDCYLARYDHQPHTLRAYRRELERLVLWSVHVARKAVSSLLVDDCEAYKRFLVAPAPAFRGGTAHRGSPLWRPFGLQPMSVDSQKYAVKVLRAAFDYLVRVRYLAGNPWQAVRDPLTIQRISPIQVERALPSLLWEMVIKILRQRGEVAGNQQDRVALAAILLMGDSGLRRSEVARLTRRDLTPSQHVHGVWMLTTLGKRNKQRLVPVSARTVAALRRHWIDHELDLYETTNLPHRPLLAPLTVPATKAAIARHQVAPEKAITGYTPDAMYRLVKSALKRVRVALASIDPAGTDVDITVEQIEQLANTSPHAFRHTFGVEAAERGMSESVLQDVLGHADSSTTKLYSRSRAKHIAEEAAQFYAQQDAQGLPRASSVETAPSRTDEAGDAA